MWIWEWASTDGGEAGAIVAQAASEGLHQLWVRVGDSMNGFYSAEELDALVPIAHAHGIDVIAWGFPYLWDPVGDAAWTAQILDWRAPDGQQVDGYSADIEEATEGVMLSAQRAAVYLELVRQVARSRLVVATVYPPTDANWTADTRTSQWHPTSTPSLRWCTGSAPIPAPTPRKTSLASRHSDRCTSSDRPSTWPVLAAGPTPRAEQRSQNF
jgi:hypothetical protein